MQLALDQPDKTATRGAKVGTRVLKRYAGKAATDKRDETWYRKAAKAARRVRTLRISSAAPRRGEMQRIERVLWDYHVEMLRISPTPTALSFDGQTWLLHGGRTTTTQLCSAPMDDLSAWIGFLENRQSQHRRAFVAIQRQVEAEREAAAERLIAGELWCHGTRRARELLMRKAQPQQGVTVLRDELTGEVTAEPDRVRALAAEYTGRLLGTQPAVLPPADQPWQTDALWAPTLRRWTHAAKADASRLATHEDIKTIIAKAGAASAPGMDGGAS
jgi:hypothetical protein